jgi:hypothetical protein
VTATPSWPCALTAPLLGLIRPRAAAGCIAAASRPAFVLMFVISLLTYAGLLIFLMLWEGTVTEAWVPSAAPLAIPSASAPFGSMTRQTTERSLAEVWAQWRRTAVYGWLGPAELSLALVALLGPVLTGALGWLGLSWVHRTGPPWPAFARAVRAGALVFSPLAVTTLLSGAAFIVREHQLYRAGWPWPSTIEPGIVLFLGVSISLWILAWWLRRALDGVAESTAPLALPPRCEECGYDLTHRPADGRCPECGTPTENSLDALHSRPGSAWTQRRAAASWRVTSHEVLLRPRAFYRRLQLRTPPAAEAGFARDRTGLLRNAFGRRLRVLAWAPHDRGTGHKLVARAARPAGHGLGRQGGRLRDDLSVGVVCVLGACARELRAGGRVALKPGQCA